jgi:MFS family permease
MKQHLPKHYRVWLGGTAASLLTSQIMAFGLIWTAAGQGGAFAGAALTAVVLPRVLLLLYGGALADRIGARRVMITSDVTMAAATMTLGTAILALGPQPWLLLAAALTTGIVDAFYLPSSSSMPRRLVPAPALARAVSARQAIGQVAVFAGPPAGGLIAATTGLAAAAFLNTLTYLLMAVILIRLRFHHPADPATPDGLPPQRATGPAAPTPAGLPPQPVPGAASRPGGFPPQPVPGAASPPGGFPPQPAAAGAPGDLPSRPATATTAGGFPPQPAAATTRGGPRPQSAATTTPGGHLQGSASGSDRLDEVGGWRVVRSDPLLRAALGLVAATAAFLLPVAGLLIPLLANSREWSAGSAGTLTGAIALGTVTVAVTFTAAGALPRPGIAAAAGLALAAAGVLALAISPVIWTAISAAAVIGLGSGLFSTHVGPLTLAGAPATHLARVQSVLILAQSVPLLLTNNVFGALNDRFDTTTVMAACAALLLVTAVAGWLSPTLRAASLGPRPQSP